MIRSITSLETVVITTYLSHIFWKVFQQKLYSYSIDSVMM